MNGFVERINQTGLDDIFGIAFCAKLYEFVEALQVDVAICLVYNNTE